MLLVVKRIFWGSNNTIFSAMKRTRFELPSKYKTSDVEAGSSSLRAGKYTFDAEGV